MVRPTFAYNRLYLLLQIGGRFLIGVGVGFAACVCPVYIQELSPTRIRGRMVVLKYVLFTYLDL